MLKIVTVKILVDTGDADQRPYDYEEGDFLNDG